MEIKREFLIGADEPVFVGHFPQRPILPGVMLLALARTAISEHVGRPVQIGEVRRQRYSKPVLPGMRVAIALHLAPREDKLEASVRWTDAGDGTTLARGELVMEFAAC